MFITSGCRWITQIALFVLVVLWDAGALAGPGKRAALAQGGLVNINTATLIELQLLSGVGPAKAQRIAEYREKHPFRTVEELGRVKGIGPKTVRKLRLFLTVRGPTTARPAGDATAASSPAVPAATPAAASQTAPAAASPAPPPALRRPDPPPAAQPRRDSLGAALPR